MVGGQSEILVYVPVDQFSDGSAQFDLSTVRVGVPGCGEDDTYAAEHYNGMFLNGCQTLQTTNVLPSGLSVSDDTGSQSAGTAASVGSLGLHAQAYQPRSVNNYQYKVPTNFELLRTNRVVMGMSTKQLAQYDAQLKDTPADVARIVIGFIPFLGDGVDLLEQAYNAASGKGVDPVMTTLATAGIAVDAFTGAGGEGIAALKNIYRVSKNLSKGGGGFLAENIGTSVRELFGKGKRPAQIISELLDQFSIFGQAFLSNGFDGLRKIDQMLVNFKSLASCSISSLNIGALSCGDAGTILKLAKNIIANTKDARISIRDVAKALNDICCGKSEIENIEAPLKALRTSAIASNIQGIIGEMEAASTLIKSGFRHINFPEKSSFRFRKPGATQDTLANPDLIVKDANGTTVLLEVKSGTSVVKDSQIESYEYMKKIYAGSYQIDAATVQKGIINTSGDFRSDDIARLRAAGFWIYNLRGVRIY